MRVVGIVERDRERVAEHRRRLVEGDAVFSPIALSLCGIPLEDHAVILPPVSSLARWLVQPGQRPRISRGASVAASGHEADRRRLHALVRLT